MISVFRKIRQSLLAKNNVSRYLMYALGEILLVMIGILLALQVNNWNEERKLKTRIDSTLRNVVFDLEADTTTAGTIIKFYEENQKNSAKILQGEITMDNYRECPQCMNLVTIYQPFNIQTKGHELLKDLVNDQTNEADSLIMDINKFYAIFEPVIEKNNDRMEGVVMKNFEDFEKFPWFVDMALGRLNNDLIEYFVLSEDYKKRVAFHAMLAVGNHLAVTRQYKSTAAELLERINKRLGKDNVVEEVDELPAINSEEQP